MTKLTPTINPDSPRETVLNLQDALRFLLQKGALRMADADRDAMLERLSAERGEYGSGTRKCVALFQDQHNVGATGFVDERTAPLMNAALDQLGGFLPQPADQARLVAGSLRREDGQPAPQTAVRAVHGSGDITIRLGQEVTDSGGRYTIRYQSLPGIDAISLKVMALDGAGTILVESKTLPAAGPLEFLDVVVPVTAQGAQRRTVRGRVVFENALPAEGIGLRLYRLDFGGAQTRVAETMSGSHGTYSLSFDSGGKPASLEVRALSGADAEVSLSQALHDLGIEELADLNLVAPLSLQPQASEFQRLSDDVTPLVNSMTELAKAREDSERQDLTMLNRATGWDSRLLLMASRATSLAADADVGLPHETLYGLFRAGLPTAKHDLAWVPQVAMEQALAKARTAGIVAMSDEQAADASRQFARFSLGTRMAVPAPGSRTTYGEILKASGIRQEAQEAFSQVYLSHQGPANQLWEAAAAAGLTAGEVETLQRQGKLAYLTVSNPRLMDHLQTTLAITDPVELVAKDLYQPERWTEHLRTAAGGDDNQLAQLIPSGYDGNTTAERLNAYSQDMARKIRLSYPNQVVQRMVGTDASDEFRLGAARVATANLLGSAIAKDFKLGQTPVTGFLNANRELLAAMTQEDAANATEGLKTLQRVYQITPSNAAMPVLMRLGFTSAHDVVAHTRESFLSRFSDKFVDPREASLVYQKSEQIAAVTYNLFTIAKELDAAPAVQAMSGTAGDRELTKKDLIKRVPTLETLFGSLDFCECEHCRSVLSPAAYLVDLLHFLDPDEPVWNNLVADWDSRHAVPFATAFKKPFEALIERRPDLPHIPLTCENTNTGLPYIDIVNEILEYYSANDQLKADAVRDTGNADSEDLLAEPRNILPAAYERLARARFPVTLPFDLWIETVRRFCSCFEVPLWRVLDVFRSTDKLFNSGEAYGRAAVFLEQLGLSPAEASLFTDPGLLGFWFELYGFDSAASATTTAIDPVTGLHVDLNSARTLARRLAVSYQELTDIVMTGFVNPDLGALRVLRKLDVTAAQVLFYGDQRALLAVPEAALTAEQKKNLVEVKAFEQRLEALTAAFSATGFDAKAWLDGALAAKSFDHILVLHDDDAGCNFDTTELRYANGKAADAQAFLRLHLFVRLWRRLGWTIDETSRALETFMPRDVPFDAEHAAQSPFRSALIYLGQFKTICDRLHVNSHNRGKLLSFWAPIPGSGDGSLYAQLFLRPGVLQADSVFDHPLGDYLSPQAIAAAAQSRTHTVTLAGVSEADRVDPAAFNGRTDIEVRHDPLSQVETLSYKGVLTAAKRAEIAALSASPVLPAMLDAVEQKARDFLALRGHLPTLQGALGLSANDVNSILQHQKLTLDAPLSLENVSLLYRHGLLARLLQLPVASLVLLKELSGVNPFAPLPFAPLNSGALGNAEDDRPLATVAFLDLAEQVKGSGLSAEDLNYLLRHRLDPANKFMPNTAASLALMKTLVDGLRNIRAAHSLPAKPEALDEETLRQKLGLILPIDVATQFLAMLNGTAEFTATVTQVEEGNQLKREMLDEAEIRDIRYDKVRKTQTLTCRGVLQDARKEALKGKFGGSVVSSLLEAVQQQAHAFFDKYLLKQAAGMSPASGFLEAADFNTLFVPTVEPALTAEQRIRLGEAFVPFLRERLSRQFVLETMVAATAADATLVESLITDERILDLPGTLLDAVGAAAVLAVDVVFTNSAGEEAGRAAVADVTTASQPAGADAAQFSGFLSVPASGAYRFFVNKPAAAAATLTFEGIAALVIQSTAAEALEEANGLVELRAGLLYRFGLNVSNPGGGNVRLTVMGESIPRDGIAVLSLYSAARLDAANQGWLVLNKALQLILRLGLSASEVRYLCTHGADFGGLRLGQLPGDASKVDNVQATGLFSQFLHLAGYARLKRELAGGSEGLIGVFEAAASGTGVGAFADLTRRDPSTVEAAARALPPGVPLRNDTAVSRLWDALQLVERLGVPVSSLLSWTRIVSPTAPPEERMEIARDLKESVKARFEQEAWNQVAQPIFDDLRRRQRDALSAYVMNRLGFESIDQLYEHFLIDPGMEPVAQTSRIRLAISSVQLFVQRCLLNLEQEVPAAVINSKQWQWMKQYRVWEANRKIFLFPENWLEPEFRDDKTSLFEDLEGALLQGDVTEDSVAEAFGNYLLKLHDVARLEIAAVHCEDNPDPALNRLHVIGRTHSNPHVYHYRTFAHQMWSAWEPVTAEVQGEHLAPVVWRNRLYLFWVTFQIQGDPNAGPADETPSPLQRLATERSFGVVAGPRANPSLKLTEMTAGGIATQARSSTATKVVEAQLHWSELADGKWSPRRSSLGTGMLTVVPASFNSSDVLIHVSRVFENGEERGVKIHLGGAINKAFYLPGRNSAPELATREAEPQVPYSKSGVVGNRYVGSGPLKVTYQRRITTEDGKPPLVSVETPAILGQGGNYTLVPIDNAIRLGTLEFGSLAAPFFYQDNSERTLFVEPTLTEKTIEAWREWVTRSPAPDPDWTLPEKWKDLSVVAAVPSWKLPRPINPGDLLWRGPSPESRYQMRDTFDWLVNPATVVSHGDEFIGPVGRTGLSVATAPQQESSMRVAVHAGAGIGAEAVLMAPHEAALEQAGLVPAAGGLNVLGTAGLNSSMVKNFESLNRVGFRSTAAGSLLQA